MLRYVAFLRGINVGGRVVVKATLLKAFNSLGYHNISTIKQSGNIIFESQELKMGEIKAEIESSLGVALGYEVHVFIRSMAQLKTIIEADHFKGQKAEGSSFLVTFLDAPATLPSPLPTTIPKSTAQVIATDGTEVYSVTHGGGEGALPNPFVEKQLKIKATTRNLNIIKDIVEKFS